MSLGQTLRAAREAKGITASELAATTHLLVQIVEGLENEDFRRIPAPIYGRGFIKLYCEVVGLDPKPLQAEFTALYAMGVDPSQRAGKSPIAQPPPAATPQKKELPQDAKASMPTPVQETPYAMKEEAPPKAFEKFSKPAQPAEAQPTAQPEPEPNKAEPEPIKPEPPPVVVPPHVASPAPASPANPAEKAQAQRRSYGELFEQAYAQPEPEKPSAAEKFRDTMSNVSHGVFANVKKLPPNTGRMVTVVVAAIVLLALIGWGVSALYTATTPQPPPEEPVPPATEAKPKNAPEKPAAKPAKQDKAAQPGKLKHSGVQIPPLYID